MPEVSIKDQVKQLVNVQKIDSQIYELKSVLEEKPKQISELKEIFEKSKLKLSGLEDKLKSIILARKDEEIELKIKEDAIAKANAALLQLKTNKEYSAKLSEIENLKADKSRFEEKILLSYDDSEAVVRDVEQERILVAQREKDYLGQKEQIEKEMKKLGDNVNVLVEQRQQLIPEIKKILLDRYERILQHKSGLALAPIRDNSCTGCNMNVTPQIINQIKMNDQWVDCEICSRILYLEDDE